MAQLRRFWFRLLNVLRPERAEPDFAHELTSHLTLLEDDLRRRGMTAEDARHAARRALNGVEQAKEIHRDARSFAWLDDARRDVVYALRSWRKSPGIALLGVVVMALGIGANAAVFSVVNTVLLKPLPYPDPDRIVTVSASSKNSTGVGPMSGPDFEDLRAQAASFEAMALYTPARPRAAVRTGEGADYGLVSLVSSDFFRVFAVHPAVGRLFTEDETQEKTRAALVSHAFAETHFGGSAKAIGRTIRLFEGGVDVALDVVGVLPVGFDFPTGTEIWATNIAARRTNRGSHNYLVVGRLKAGAPLERAQAEIGAIAAQLEQQHPQTNTGRSAVVTQLHDQIVGNVRLGLYLLLGAVALVLCIACANMATLLLARATARTQEIAVRAALGASRGRIVRQMLLEGLLQGLVAGAAGLMLALWGTRALVALAPSDMPRLTEVRVDVPVLAFTLSVSVISSLLLALAPAFQAARVDAEGALRQGTTRTVAGGRTRHVQDGLVMAQIAMAVVLLATGGLLIKSFTALQRVALGFRPEHVLVVDATVPNADPKAGDTLFFRDLLTEVSKLPSVLGAGATMSPPGRVDATSTYAIDHLPDPAELSTGPLTVMSIISPGTFAALGIPVARGRDFDDRDILGAPRTAIVNETLARQALPDRDVIGHTIFCAFDSLDPMTIVGIVGDVREYGPAQEPRPECYMPYLQHFYNGGTLSLVIRTAADPASLAETARRKAQELSPAVPVRFRTMETLVAEDTAAPRFRALLVGVFAAIALVLAAVGLFGVMAYVVGQQTSAIGLRMALGATPANIVWLLFGQGLAVTAGGLTLGLVGAAIATRFVSALLFDVKPDDPLTYASVAGLLGLTSLVAMYVPARRATKVDPLVALRAE